MDQPLSGPLCQVLIDLLAEWRHVEFVARALGLEKRGDLHKKIREALSGQPLEIQRHLLLQLILEHYHQTDKYSQRGDSVQKAMVMLLGKQKADEIDSTFAPDLKKPAKKGVQE